MQIASSQVCDLIWHESNLHKWCVEGRVRIWESLFCSQRAARSGIYIYRNTVFLSGFCSILFLECNSFQKNVFFAHQVWDATGFKHSALTSCDPVWPWRSTGHISHFGNDRHEKKVIECAKFCLPYDCHVCSPVHPLRNDAFLCTASCRKGK